MTELIQQVRVLDPETGMDAIADVLIEAGTEAIAPHIDHPTATIQNGAGKILGPGLVDLYSYSSEPGHEDRETLADLTAAAQAGGFTRITLFPATLPPLDHAPALIAQHQRCQNLPVRCQWWGAMTLGLRGEQMTELAELAPHVVGFSDGAAMPELGMLRRILEYGQPLGKPVAIMPIFANLQGKGVIRDGESAVELGLQGDPSYSETAAVAAVLELVAQFPTPVHFLRISTARSVELIAAAQSRGLPITASTTWLHLLLDTTAIASYDPNLHLQAPLGNHEDCLALRDGVKGGVLGAIAIDHTPLTYGEKTVSFAESPPGTLGLSLALPLLWEGLVTTGIWTALELWQALSTGPARCLGQEPPRCQAGAPAELTLFDPAESWEVTGESLRSPSTNSPWLGQTITGRVIPF